MTEDSIDARGLLCPLPVLKARKKLLQAAGPLRLTVLMDRGSDKDLRLFCADMGYRLAACGDAGDHSVIVIEKD